MNLHPPLHIYGPTPDYGDDWVAFAKYYMANIWKGTGKPKMALQLLQGTVGQGTLDGAKAMADQLGIDLVDIETHALNTTSEIESLTRIKAMNPDVLFISSVPAGHSGHNQKCRGPGDVSRHHNRLRLSQFYQGIG